jgi:hypothetical protein
LPNSKAFSKSFIKELLIFSTFYHSHLIHNFRYAHTLFQVLIILEFLLAVFAPDLKPVHTKFLFIRHAIVYNVIITLATFWTYRLVCMSQINCLIAHIITFINGMVSTVAAKIAGAKTVSVFKYVFSLMPLISAHKRPIILAKSNNITILSLK